MNITIEKEKRLFIFIYDGLISDIAFMCKARRCKKLF